jgi:hypothetical protein
MAASPAQSIWHAYAAFRLESPRIPLQFAQKARRRECRGWVMRNALFGERAVNVGKGQDGRNARHAKFAQGHPQLHGGADAAKTASAIAGDRRWPPEIFLQKMIEQIFERRWNAVIVFAAHDHESGGLLVKIHKFVERRRRVAFVFLLYAAEQRQPVHHRIDQGCRMAPAPDLRLDITHGLDAFPLRPDRAVNNYEVHWFEPSKDYELCLRHLTLHWWLSLSRIWHR